ncbi:hypothetical protein ASG07_16625 [Sphingomonas sp. Leaf343]|nr:hypothetical protein ASG07_16625 [Sphingomonas sp. Leaf343]
MSYNPVDVPQGPVESNRLRIMGVLQTSWPEGLSDEEALQRLQTLCLGACDGIQDLADDARYKALRRALLARVDLRPLAPSFIAAQPGLEAFVRHIRETKDRAARRDRVRQEFLPLWNEIRGDEPVSSAAWTGRPARHEQAAIVQALAPIALEAVQRLIDDEERALGNGGPVDTDRAVALQQLRALHDALGQLIMCVEREQPLTTALSRLQVIRQEARVTLGRLVTALPVTTSALMAFGSVVGIAEIFVGNVVISVAAGAMAGNTVKDAMLKKDAAASSAAGRP